MSNIDIYFVTPVFEKASTGPAVYALYLWNYLINELEFDFHIVTANSDVQHSRVHNLQLTDHSGAAFYDPIAKRALSLARESKGRAIIHGNSTHTMAACIGCAYPWVVQVNDYETAEVMRRPVHVVRQSGLRRLVALMWRQRRERMVLQAADYAICNSYFVRNRMLESYAGLDPQRLKVMHKAVDTRLFERPDILPPDPWGDQTTGIRLLTVGTNWRLKGVPDLIAAVAAAKATVPDIHLMIVGPSSQEDRAAIDRIAADAGIGGAVTLAGRVEREDLGPYLWHADIFALPSYSEAFGVAVLEAMAAALPVICSNIGGLPEIVPDDDHGLTVPPGRPDALAAAVLRLANDATLRKALSNRGPVRAQSFTAERMVENVREFYLQLAEARFGKS